MHNQDYIQELRLLLQAFEKTQEGMLLLDMNHAVKDFHQEIKMMKSFFYEKLSDLEKSELSDNILLLFSKQIKRMLAFLTELNGLLNKIKNKSTVDTAYIIFLFERQHLFKNVYRKHINDYRQFSGVLK